MRVLCGFELGAAYMQPLGGYPPREISEFRLVMLYEV